GGGGGGGQGGAGVANVESGEPAVVRTLGRGLPEAPLRDDQRPAAFRIEILQQLHVRSLVCRVWVCLPRPVSAIRQNTSRDIRQSEPKRLRHLFAPLPLRDLAAVRAPGSNFLWTTQGVSRLGCGSRRKLGCNRWPATFSHGGKGDLIDSTVEAEGQDRSPSGSRKPLIITARLTTFQ